MKTAISRDTSAATLLDDLKPETQKSKMPRKTRSGDKVVSLKRKAKRKRTGNPKTSESESSEGESSTKRVKMEFQECHFTHQGCWVAAAYDDTFYIGEVVHVVNETNAVVKFLRCYRDTLFKYPDSEDIESLENQHVFHMNFEVTTQNGRIWCVPEIQTIRAMYEIFKKKFNYG